ncbi:hypothetical protein [Streptomyces sp. NPDC005799]|uniref:hypothetical protein n=1 Tax=Streptomyces sp. NPDC005799 TaxID=3154678 RepID=UPI0033FB17BB
MLIERSIAEARDHDIDRTMATLVQDCVYHYWGDPCPLKQTDQEVVGAEAVRANYVEGMANGALDMDSLEVDVERFFINDGTIA